MCCICRKCRALSGLVLLIFGILFLLRDLNVWDFWGISWWTVIFVLMGVVGLCSGSCASCQAKRKR